MNGMNGRDLKKCFQLACNMLFYASGVKGYNCIIIILYNTQFNT